MIAAEAAIIASRLRMDHKRNPPIRRTLLLAWFCSSIPFFFFSMLLYYSRGKGEYLWGNWPFGLFWPKNSLPFGLGAQKSRKISVEELGFVEKGCLRVEAENLTISNVKKIAVGAIWISNRNHPRVRTIGIRRWNTYCLQFRNQGHSR